MPFEQDFGYTYEGSVQVGKFSVVKSSSNTYKDGFVLTASQGDGPVLGIVQDGVYPHGASDYSKGVYAGVSDVSWPSNVQPTSPVGLKRTVRRFGRSQAIAAGAIARGDRLIAANNLGQVASVVTLSIAGGTAIKVVGVAETACSNQGDVVYVMVDPHNETV
jgi:hypothetical protein